jgi:hypothetical protein
MMNQRIVYKNIQSFDDLLSQNNEIIKNSHLEDKIKLLMLQKFRIFILFNNHGYSPNNLCIFIEYENILNHYLFERGLYKYNLNIKVISFSDNEHLETTEIGPLYYKCTDNNDTRDHINDIYNNNLFINTDEIKYVLEKTYYYSITINDENNEYNSIIDYIINILSDRMKNY